MNWTFTDLDNDFKPISSQIIIEITALIKHKYDPVEQYLLEILVKSICDMNQYSLF